MIYWDPLFNYGYAPMQLWYCQVSLQGCAVWFLWCNDHGGLRTFRLCVTILRRYSGAYKGAVRLLAEESAKAGARLGRSWAVSVWGLIRLRSGRATYLCWLQRTSAARVAWGRSSLFTCRSLRGPQTTEDCGRSCKLQVFGRGRVDRGGVWHGWTRCRGMLVSSGILMNTSRRREPVHEIIPVSLGAVQFYHIIFLMFSLIEHLLAIFTYIWHMGNAWVVGSNHKGVWPRCEENIIDRFNRFKIKNSFKSLSTWTWTDKLNWFFSNWPPLIFRCYTSLLMISAHMAFENSICTKKIFADFTFKFCFIFQSSVVGFFLLFNNI